VNNVENYSPSIRFAFEIQKSVIKSMEHQGESLEKNKSKHQVVNFENLKDLSSEISRFLSYGLRLLSQDTKPQKAGDKKQNRHKTVYLKLIVSYIINSR